MAHWIGESKALFRENKGRITIKTNKLNPSTKNKTIRGIIFIIHGMGEHYGRYKELKEYMGNYGYEVVGIDHKGHGKNFVRYNEENKLGYIDDDFSSSLEELEKAIVKVKVENKNIPVYILGHSMGSFITQVLLGQGIKVDGIILSGSNRPNKIKIKLGYLLSLALLKSRNKRDILLENLAFGLNNLKFKGNKNKFRWLSRDVEKVKEYQLDPLCGCIPYTSYFRGMFKVILESIKIEGKKERRKIPMYIFSGEADPIGEYGKGVRRLYKFYKNMGYNNLKLKLYPEGRHEMLNEINREEVYKNLIEWLDMTIEKSRKSTTK